MPDTNSPEFWESIYQNNQAGWDLSGPTPVFHRLLGSGLYPPGKMIVLGAGRGHDARMFAAHGFEVTAVDFAGDAVREMKALMTSETAHITIQSDIFELPPEYENTFDYVLEYTCFCAIDPSRRADYADLVARLLKPAGTYIALAFPVVNRPGGPPFAVSPDEMVTLFKARGFFLIDREVPADSVPQRCGIEELLILQASGQSPAAGI